jgi:CRISPR-associated endonuclease Csn1
MGAQIIKKAFAGTAKPPGVISLPGSVTGTVRKGWNLIGCLAMAAPQVKEADGSIKNKTEIRGLTHLHHALDACVIGLASHYLPSNGSLWELMLKRNPTAGEKTILRATGYFDFDAQGRFGLRELPDVLKEQISRRLAEKRVVQHIPADMSGMRVEDNTRGVTMVKDGRVFLRQQTRDPKTGKISVKETEESAGKVIGLKPGKLTPQKGVRVITDNFGVAILDHAKEGEERFIIVPWHKVWPRIQELKPRNDGKTPRILRIGTLIRVSKKAGRSDYRGLWMVRGVQLNRRAGFLVDLSAPDVIEYRVSGRDDCAQNIRLQALFDGGLEILKTPLTGIPSSSGDAIK